MEASFRWTRLDGLEMPEIGEVIRIKVGRQGLALARDAAGLCALADRCPHMGALLSTGSVDDGRLVCPWHGRAYDLRTGACEGFQPVPAYPIELRGDGVYVRLPAQADSPDSRTGP